MKRTGDLVGIITHPVWAHWHLDNHNESITPSRDGIIRWRLSHTTEIYSVARMNLYDTRTSFSTLTITISEYCVKRIDEFFHVCWIEQSTSRHLHNHKGLSRGRSIWVRGGGLNLYEDGGGHSPALYLIDAVTWKKLIQECQKAKERPAPFQKFSLM
jgi:hypothetical protein